MPASARRLLLVCLVAFGLDQALAQTDSAISLHANRLDTLLGNGDWDGFLRAWAQSSRDSSAFTKVMWAELGDFASTLRASFKLTDGRADTICNEILRIGGKFSVERGGPQASVAYATMVRRIADGNRKEAVRWYLLASFRRKIFVQENAAQIAGMEIAAEEAYNRRRYDLVLAAVDTFSRWDERDPSFLSVRDTLKPLYDRLERLTRTAMSLTWTEEPTEPVQKALSISAGSGAILLPRTNNYRGTYWYAKRLWRLVPQSQFRPMMDAQVIYHLGQRFGIGVNYAAAVMYSDSIIHSIDMLVIRSRLRQHMAQVNLLGAYWFRIGAGMRPYCTLKLGTLQIQRETIRIESSVYGVSTPFSALTIIYPTVAVEAGCDYEISTSFPLFVSAYVSAFDEFSDQSLIHHFVPSAGIRVGVTVLR